MDDHWIVDVFTFWAFVLNQKNVKKSIGNIFFIGVSISMIYFLISGWNDGFYTFRGKHNYKPLEFIIDIVGAGIELH